MNKAFSVALGMVLAAGVLLPVAAGDGKTGDVELTGWITDEWCGAKNANAEGVGCAKACAEKGAALVLYTGDKLYKLSDRELALEHIGYKVKVTGTIEEETVNVASIAKADDA